LGWLTSVERSPNTVRAYALDLKAFWSFLEARGIGWRAVTVEQLGWFAEWLRRPVENVVLLQGAVPARSARTVNRMLSAVAGFYEFHGRRGERLRLDLRPVAGRSGGGGGPVAFLSGIAAASPRGRAGRLPEQPRLPRPLSVAEVAAVIAAQRRLRDRFLFALLFGTGMRIGQALGLRHEDVLARARAIRLVARVDNANGTRGKGAVGLVPVWAGLMRLQTTTCTRSTARSIATTCL
jgi:integrase/recombinase XerD